ncbi:hypothetical protein GGD38_007630 [Chitinophagaceae bacterium OAS944]|nr:hypothetical protein [Chitinophagaceae bacterium OAS944]
MEKEETDVWNHVLRGFIDPKDVIVGRFGGEEQEMRNN